MTEVPVNDFNIDPDEYARLVRDAERMRSESLRALLTAAWTGLSGFGASTVKFARALASRRKWNLSVPAPHR